MLQISPCALKNSVLKNISPTVKGKEVPLHAMEREPQTSQLLYFTVFWPCVACTLHIICRLTSHSIHICIMHKAKAVPLHTTEALGGEEVQLLLIHDLGTR
jgi:hypothetical protein